MDRIQKTFENGKALITYITGGDPSLEFTREIIPQLENAGADIIEIGIPFSDPLADGPIIQEASKRALKNGTTLKGILKTLDDIKGKTRVPIVLMGYYNSILNYGLENFISDAVCTGIAGIIVPDLPFDEDKEFYKQVKESGLDPIFLVAPNTSERRLEAISKLCSGFLYCVSLMGVTGDSRGPVSYLKEYSEKIRKYIDIPLAIGFGIDNPEKVKNSIAYFDGVIVGSALVRIIDQNKEKRERMFGEIADFVKNLKVW